MKILALTLLSAALAPAALLPFHADEREVPRVRLAEIRSLEGTWYRVGEDGEPEKEPFSTFRTTAAGNVVLETIFVGTEKEMITVYHEENGRLALTHYCMLGNRPHMHLDDAATRDAFSFTCDGSGLDCAVDKHMHQAHFVRVSEDRIKTEWRLLDEGEHTYSGKFDLVRGRE